MYPAISDFLREVLNINLPLPVQSYGFFVALGFLVGAWVMTLEMKRQEKLGLLKSIKKKVLIGKPASPQELAISAIVGFIIGFKVVHAFFHYSELVANPQEFILSTTGNFIGGILAAALSAYLTFRDKNKEKLDEPKWVEKEFFPHQMAGNLLVVAGVFGLLGAKIFAILENFSAFLQDPIGELFSFSGLTFLGGFIVGTGAMYFYAKKQNIKFLQLIDIGALFVPVGYAIGRLGCQVSGDGCWGIENPNPQPAWLSWLPDWTWSYNYPHNIIKEGVRMADCNPEVWNGHCFVLPTPVFPTPLYEFGMMFIIFGIIWFLRNKINIQGMLFGIYLTLAGLERFIIEQVRVNVKYDISGFKFTQAELIATLMIIAGIIMTSVLYKRHKNQNLSN